MAQERLAQVISFLVQALQLEPLDNVDPLDPLLPIQALIRMFPQSQPSWQHVVQHQQAEEQWSAVLQFIETNLLDNTPIEIDSLGLEEILQIYQLLALYTEKWLQNQKAVKAKPDHQAQASRKKQAKGQQISKAASLKKNKTSDVQKKPKQQQSSVKTKEVKKQRPKAEEKRLQQEIVEGIVDIISKPVHKVDPKTSTLFRDPKGQEAVSRANRQFQHFLKEYDRQKKLKTKFKPYLPKKNIQEGIDRHFLKTLQNRQQKMEQEVTNQQLKYLLSLRDRKVAFINKIHRLTEQLQKERQINWAQQQRELMQRQKQKIRLQVAKTEDIFDKNMGLMKEQYRQRRKQQQSQQCDELNVCRQLQRAVEKQKLAELDTMKVLWEQENMKLNNIIGDEERLKNKLIDIYRKNRP